MPTKGFFQSKIILLALLGLVLQLVAPLLHHTYDPATGDVEESIVSAIFGGGNWIEILISVLIIIARWLFTDTKIGGFLKPGAGLLTAVVLLTAVSLSMGRPGAYKPPGKAEAVINIDSFQYQLPDHFINEGGATDHSYSMTGVY